MGIEESIKSWYLHPRLSQTKYLLGKICTPLSPPPIKTVLRGKQSDGRLLKGPTRSGGWLQPGQTKKFLLGKIWTPLNPLSKLS